MCVYSDAHLLFVFPSTGEDDCNLVYYRDGSGPSTYEFGWEVPAHDVEKYIGRLTAFRNNVPLMLEGWRLGFACSVDEECIPPQHCIHHQCHEGVDGDPCKYHDDCDSGRCAGFITSLFTGECKPQLKTGEGCTSDAVCKSAECAWFVCA